jgi:hypothetical protein
MPPSCTDTKTHCGYCESTTVSIVGLLHPGVAVQFSCPDTFSCTSPVPDGKCTKLADGSGKFASMDACTTDPTCAAPTFNCHNPLDGTCTTMTGGAGKFHSMDACTADKECRSSSFKILGVDTKQSVLVVSIAGGVVLLVVLGVLCCCAVRIRNQKRARDNYRLLAQHQQQQRQPQRGSGSASGRGSAPNRGNGSRGSGRTGGSNNYYKV